jgi:hypothetical protein
MGLCCLCSYCLRCWQICLCTECAWRKIQRPDYLCSWVDLKQQFGAMYKQRGNLRTCVEAAGEIMLAVRHKTWSLKAHLHCIRNINVGCLPLVAVLAVLAGTMVSYVCSGNRLCCYIVCDFILQHSCS